MMELEKYPCTPLNGLDEIRLLELKPGSGDEAVKCNLHPYIISKTHYRSYEAISYEWGTPGQYEYIDLNGQRYRIQANFVSIS
jgi:hypothetical protein